MPKIKAFLSLSRPEKFFFARAFFWQVYFRLLLSTSSFEDIVQKASRLKNIYLKKKPHTPVSTIQAIKLIHHAARLTPFSTCLTRSLAGLTSLAQTGIDSDITIGVIKKKDQPFSAHAWLTSHDQLITGFLPNLEDFTPIPSPFTKDQP